MWALRNSWAILRRGWVDIKSDKQFFFEKKNQKTFVTWGTPWIQRVPRWAKVFASVFKKKRFLGLARHDMACLAVCLGVMARAAHHINGLVGPGCVARRVHCLACAGARQAASEADLSPFVATRKVASSGWRSLSSRRVCHGPNSLRGSMRFGGGNGSIRLDT